MFFNFEKIESSAIINCREIESSAIINLRGVSTKLNKYSVDVVCRGIETNEELRGMSPRRIYNKLKDIQKDSNALVPVRKPPQEHESMPDKLEKKMGKKLTNWTDSEEAATIDDDQASTSITASMERNSTFNDNAVGTIHTLFKDTICGTTTISRVELDKRCSSSRDGCNLLQNSTPLALVNWIKYEQRKYRLGFGKKTTLGSEILFSKGY